MKRTLRPFWQAARPRARAMCVFPTPEGPSRPEARLEEAAQGVEGRIELPSPQRGRLVQRARLLHC